MSADVLSASALIEHGRTGLLVRAADTSAYVATVDFLVREPVIRAVLGHAAVEASL